MKYHFLLSLIFQSMMMISIFDFDKISDLENWYIVDDGVMGGLSHGKLYLNEDGHGVFEGTISLDNYGGFSSVRYSMNNLSVSPENKIRITLKGDGKDYQFRVKDNSERYYSYITQFSTSGEWEEIEITLSDLYPSFRGRKLNMPNFESNNISELAFLFGNKKVEDFRLIIDKIEVV